MRANKTIGLSPLHNRRSKNMAHKIEGNRLIIDLDINSKTKSKTGKTYLLATSNGFQDGELQDGTKIGISYNITRKVPN